jgi:uncharacterized SAM-binding protein YcdF (DUF218 family)
VLATSALQMPRAMGVAQRLGWPMIAWPTDYTTPPRSSSWNVFGEINMPARLTLVDEATHEWLGLAAYRLDGKGGPRR